MYGKIKLPNYLLINPQGDKLAGQYNNMDKDNLPQATGNTTQLQ
jgi:hypothetical protein